VKAELERFHCILPC